MEIIKIQKAYNEKTEKFMKTYKKQKDTLGNQIKEEVIAYNPSWLNCFFGNIKVVGFDFDNTLVDENYSIKRRWQKVLREYSYLSSDLEGTFFKIYECRGYTYKFHLNDTMSELKLDERFIKEIVAKFLTTRDDELLLEGSLELLKFLTGKNIKVGIITDGKQSLQEERIKKAGIYKFMDFIYYGDQKQKPHTRAFKQCFKLFPLKSPEQFLYVGNDFIRDVQSVSSLGTKACWITNEKYLQTMPNIIKTQNFKELLKYFREVFK